MIRSFHGAALLYPGICNIEGVKKLALSLYISDLVRETITVCVRIIEYKR